MTSIIPQPVPADMRYDLSQYPAEIHSLLIAVHNARLRLSDEFSGGSLAFSVELTCEANPSKAPKITFKLVHSDYSMSPSYQDTTGVDIFDLSSEMLRLRKRDIGMMKLQDLRSNKGNPF